MNHYNFLPLTSAKSLGPLLRNDDKRDENEIKQNIKMTFHKGKDFWEILCMQEEQKLPV
jgi:hypothetical protein